MSWGLKDKNGKYRSRRAYKQDARNDSDEPWELRRKQKNNGTPNIWSFFGK